MATNKLEEILKEEGITLKQYAAAASIGEKIVKKIYNKKRTPAPVTKVDLVESLNKLAKKEYTVDGVFPGSDN